MSRAYAPDIAALTTALFYGVTFLGEQLTAQAVGGLVLILLGVALGSGLVRLTRGVPVGETP